jgi:hypothetical protein
LRRRVFWSIHLLEQVYGQGCKLLDVLDDVENPKYFGVRKDPQRQTGVTPPLTPEESTNNAQGRSAGLWTYMVQLATLWSEVKSYVSHCAEDSPNPKPPWSIDSGYTVIGAQMMDIETSFPAIHRYDAARFKEQSSEDLKNNRDYWGPWLNIQFTYHAIHSMLNHPFLYSSRPQQPKKLAVPNTFWKTSLDLALLHATWIVGLIDMVSEKDFQVSDPFLGHCAAIAATVHLYYCRAAHSRIRQTAQEKLAKCINLLNELSAVWPVCQMMVSN